LDQSVFWGLSGMPYKAEGFLVPQIIGKLHNLVRCSLSFVIAFFLCLRNILVFCDYLVSLFAAHFQFHGYFCVDYV